MLRTAVAPARQHWPCTHFCTETWLTVLTVLTCPSSDEKGLLHSQTYQCLRVAHGTMLFRPRFCCCRYAPYLIGFGRPTLLPELDASCICSVSRSRIAAADYEDVPEHDDCVDYSQRSVLAYCVDHLATEGYGSFWPRSASNSSYLGHLYPSR